MKQITLIVISLLLAIPATTLSPLLDTYYGIKDSLVASDPRAASAKAKLFLQTLDDIHESDLTTAQSAALKPLAPKLKASATAIAAATSLPLQRDLFVILSDEMYQLAKAAPLSGEPVYREYCPMKKAYWLSKDQPIKNPFFGNAMLTCGSVAEALK
jgi:hypothetical protein